MLVKFIFAILFHIKFYGYSIWKQILYAKYKSANMEQEFGKQFPDTSNDSPSTGSSPPPKNAMLDLPPST